MTGIVTRTGTLTITEWNTEQTSDTCLHVARSEDTWRNIFSSISGGRWARLMVDMVRESLPSLVEGRQLEWHLSVTLSLVTLQATITYEVNNF